MKLTTSKLKRLIKEELSSILGEQKQYGQARQGGVSAGHLLKRGLGMAVDEPIGAAGAAKKAARRAGWSSKKKAAAPTILDKDAAVAKEKQYKFPKAVKTLRLAVKKLQNLKMHKKDKNEINKQKKLVNQYYKLAMAATDNPRYQQTATDIYMKAGISSGGGGKGGRRRSGGRGFNEKRRSTRRGCKALEARYGQGRDCKGMYDHFYNELAKANLIDTLGRAGKDYRWGRGHVDALTFLKGGTKKKGRGTTMSPETAKMVQTGKGRAVGSAPTKAAGKNARHAALIRAHQKLSGLVKKAERNLAKAETLEGDAGFKQAAKANNTLHRVKKQKAALEKQIEAVGAEQG